MDISHEISPQYITKKQITVTIIDFVDPAHYVVKESPDLLNASSEAKDFLEAENAMQKYYASVQPCFFQLPLKDSIIVILYKDKFYRAKVIRILTMSAGHLFRVYLVDYGMECSIPRDCIYEIERDFLVHPFQAVNIKLLGIEPISLIMNPSDLTMSYGPVSYWDPSAEIYVHDLQKGMCSAYIEVEGIDDQHIYGRLYICYESIPTKCINNDLISNSFARFNEDCWKDVHKIENVLESHITEAADSAVESISENSNPEQMSSTPNHPKIESDFKDFKMMFIDPSDGTIVAESSLTRNTLKSPLKVENNLEPQPAVSPRKETVPESCDFVNKSLKLSPNIEGKTSKSEVSEESKSTEVTSEEQKPALSPRKETVSESYGFVNKSLKLSPNIEGKTSKSEARLIAQKRFQKLRQLNQKKHQSDIHLSNVDTASMKNLQTVAENKTDVRNLPIDGCVEKTEKFSSEMTLGDSNAIAASKSSISSVNDNSKSSNVIQQSNFSNDKVQAASEDSLKQEDATLAQIVLQKEMQNPQLLQKRLPASSVHQMNVDSTSTQNLPSSVEKTVSKENSSVGVCLARVDSSSSEQNVNEKNLSNTTINHNMPIISNDNKTNSIPTHQSNVFSDAVPIKTEKDSVTENLTRDQLIAQKRLLRLQQLNRKQLRSPIRSSTLDPGVVKHLPTVVENTANKDTATNLCSDKIESRTSAPAVIEIERSNAILSKPDVSSDCDNSNIDNQNCQSHASNDKIQAASESNSKQESPPEVILENLKTLQRLQKRVRLKRMKESLQMSEEISDGVKQIEETFKDNCSIDSPSNVIFTSSDQLNQSLSSSKSSEEIMY